MGIRIFAIGVGPEVTQTMLNQIADQPSDIYTFKVDEYNELEGIIKRVSSAACQVMPTGTGELPCAAPCCTLLCLMSVPSQPGGCVEAQASTLPAVC